MGLNFQVHQRASEFNESYDIFLDLYGDIRWKPFETDFRPMCVRCNYASVVIGDNPKFSPEPKTQTLYFRVNQKLLCNFP